MNPVLKVQGLSLSRGPQQVLAGVDLVVDAGEAVAVTGSSGSGKTTILSCVLGLEKPSGGTIEVDGTVVDARRRGRTAALRRRTMGAVFQAGELLPELTPVENVVIAGLLNGSGRAEAEAKARLLLSELGVPSARRSTAELSGGERQRVAVARALVNDPVLLLADEPTGALDAEVRDATLTMILQGCRDRGCAVVLVTHDPDVAGRADRHLLLRDGRLRPVGPPSAETLSTVQSVGH